MDERVKHIVSPWVVCLGWLPLGTPSELMERKQAARDHQTGLSGRTLYNEDAGWAQAAPVAVHDVGVAQA